MNRAAVNKCQNCNFTLWIHFWWTQMLTEHFVCPRGRKLQTPDLDIYTCLSYVDTRKTDTQRTQRDWWYLTIQAWRLRSSSSSSRIPRPPHICWIPPSWLSNLARNRYHSTVYFFRSYLSFRSLLMCDQSRNICWSNTDYCDNTGMCKYSFVLPGVDCVGLPNKTWSN